MLKESIKKFKESISKQKEHRKSCSIFNSINNNYNCNKYNMGRKKRRNKSRERQYII